RARRPDDLRRGADRAGLAGHARRGGRRPGPCCGAAQSPWRWPCRQALHRQPLWPRLRFYLACDARARAVRNPRRADRDGPRPGNLPALLTRVVGRDGVISRLAQQLVRRRFLTLTNGTLSAFPDILRQRRTQSVTSPPLGTPSARKWVEKQITSGACRQPW